VTQDAAVALARGGPRVDVEVSPRPVAGQRPGRIVRVAFLVDTGADMTVLSQTVVDALRVPSIGDTFVAGVTDSDPVLVPVYWLHLALPGAAPIEVYASVLPRGDDAVQGLLGRDALASLRFTYDGPRGAFTIEPG